MYSIKRAISLLHEKLQNKFDTAFRSQHFILKVFKILLALFRKRVSTAFRNPLIAYFVTLFCTSFFSSTYNCYFSKKTSDTYCQKCPQLQNNIQNTYQLPNNNLEFLYKSGFQILKIQFLTYGCLVEIQLQDLNPKFVVVRNRFPTE